MLILSIMYWCSVKNFCTSVLELHNAFWQLFLFQQHNQHIRDWTIGCVNLKFSSILDKYWISLSTGKPVEIWTQKLQAKSGDANIEPTLLVMPKTFFVFLDLIMVLFCWGRLVQWENVRLQIQRSGFASRLRRYFFHMCSKVHIYTGPWFISSAAKSESAIYWKWKQSSILPCIKRNVHVPTNWPYDVTS